MTQGITDKIVFWRDQKLPMIQQTEAAECGLACMAMVAGYHGHNINLNEIRRLFKLSIEGCTLLDLMGFAEKLKLTSRPLKLELSHLKQLKTPSILHWDLNHFVVLKSVKNNHCTIYDPAYGERLLSLDEVSEHFTGIALELIPTTDFAQKEKGASLRLSDFWSEMTGLKRSLALMFTLSILLQVFLLVSPYYIQLVVDDVILTSDTSLLIVLAVGFGLVLLFDVMTQGLRSFVLLHFSNQLNVQLASNLFHHLIRLPMNFFGTRHIGDVLSRFGSLQHIRELLTTGVLEVIIDGILAIGLGIMLLVYSPLLASVVLSTVVLYGLFRAAAFRPLRDVTEKEIIAKAKEQSNFMETIRGIQSVKLFGSEAKMEGKWQNYYIDSTNESIRLGIFNISYRMINKLLFGLENIIVIYLAALLVIDGGFSVGMLFAFTAYKSQFMARMSSLIEKYIQFRMIRLHFERLADIALTQKESLYSEDRKPIEPFTNSIELRRVSFSYSDVSKPIINSLSLRILEGEFVAIVGASGSGKTTLMKLMLGLLPCSDGEILIDGSVLTHAGFGEYRSQVAAVMQDDQLMSGSIQDNIAFFSEPVDYPKLLQCAGMASVHQDIMNMPMGYNSLIGVFLIWWPKATHITC
jgi:ATP-binding cassette subfamily B protein RaxB